MPIPDYQTCMLPFLQYLSDETDHTLRDAEESLAGHFRLTPAERAELLPSGQQGVFKNRIGWARTYLKKSALLESPKRGVFKITARGLKTLASGPNRIDVKYLEQFSEFIEFRDASKAEGGIIAAVELPQSKTTPEEAIELAHQGLREQLASELLVRILGCSPTFFEQLVVELDGSVHDNPAQAELDADRQRVIKSISIRFLRLSNDIVVSDLTGALRMIAAEFNTHGAASNRNDDRDTPCEMHGVRLRNPSPLEGEGWRRAPG